MYFAQRSVLFPGAVGNDGAVVDMPPWGERLAFETPDGERLEARYSSPPTGQPVAIFFHGNADTVSNYGFLAGEFARRGIGLLAISYRGYGGSTGSPGEAGLIVDGLAAFDWLMEQHEGPAVLIGQSLGSAVAVAVAAKRQAAGVILISAPDSMRALAQGHYPYLPVAPLMRDPFRSDQRIGDVEEPKLFLHGDRDTIVPLSHGQALFDLAAEPKEWRVLAGYGHNDIWTPDLVEIVADFIERPGPN
jgi:uncharacterized protein